MHCGGLSVQKLPQPHTAGNKTLSAVSVQGGRKENNALRLHLSDLWNTLAKTIATFSEGSKMWCFSRLGETELLTRGQSLTSLPAEEEADNLTIIKYQRPPPQERCWNPDFISSAAQRWVC